MNIFQYVICLIMVASDVSKLQDDVVMSNVVNMSARIFESKKAFL